MYPEGWLQQAFNFRQPHTRLSFGLVQKKGGPCGVLAVVQAFILKFVLFQSPSSNNTHLQLSQQQQEKALIGALTHILCQVKYIGYILLTEEQRHFYSARFLKGCTPTYLITFSIHS